MVFLLALVVGMAVRWVLRRATAQRSDDAPGSPRGQQRPQWGWLSGHPGAAEQVAAGPGSESKYA